MNNTKKGFTLVELLVVIAILAILATVSVVGYTSFIERANVSNAQTEAHQIKTVIESALIGVDYVIVDDTTGSTIYAQEVDGEVVFTATAPTVTGTPKTADVSDDLATYLAKLSLVSGELHYAYSSDVTVDVLTGEKQ